MSWDIAARMADYLERQMQALQSVEQNWESFLQREGDFSDDDLSRIEELQNRHMYALDPLDAEFACLQNEWEKSDLTEETRVEIAGLSNRVAGTLERVQAMEAQLLARIQVQMETVSAEAQELRRGRKMTRDYGASRPDDAQYMDRQV